MAETGHAKNVENWQKMIAACTGFGGNYKPWNVNLTLGSMTTLLTDVETETDGELERARELWTKARDLYARIGMPHRVEKCRDWLDGLPPPKNHEKTKK